MEAIPFQEWVQTHSQRVFGLAYRITGHVQDAEEVVQETFLRAYRRRATFRGESSPQTWICRIATHCALDLLRKRKRLKEDDMETEPLNLPVQASQANQSLNNKHIREQLGQAMKQLSSMERAAFVLRHFEGHSCRDIGKALDCNENRAKQAVFRAVGKLRKALKPLVTS